MTLVRVLELVALTWACLLFSFTQQVGAQVAAPTSPVSNPQNNIDLARFVTMPPVRQELKLTEAQITELAIIETEMKGHMHEIIRRMQTLGPDEKRDAAAELQKEMETSRRLCTQVFTPEQVLRVKQLALQFNSKSAGNGFGLLGKAMRKELEITDDQASIIRERATEIDKQLKAREAEMKADLEVMRIKLQKELIDSLLPAQTTKAKAMFGDFIPLDD